MTASTVTATKSLGTQLDQADPNTLADVLRQVQLGTILTPLKKTLTLSAFGTVFTLNPPALTVNTFRVSDNTGGNAAVGARFIGDAGATASSTVAKLSDDGTTITVEGTGALAAVVEYIPRSATDLTAAEPDTDD